ncbi:hypothetical protein JZ751_016394 [Albula glossodonta]|uniref:RRM domain-containing protein n=1 Tax=Albula glossodonta TaxID=121402 RepID=A0A8T2NY45_9TELE|nr:hypothetical protein JZ751_016394 [Albula glossodonta]
MSHREPCDSVTPETVRTRNRPAGLGLGLALGLGFVLGYDSYEEYQQECLRREVYRRDYEKREYERAEQRERQRQKAIWNFDGSSRPSGCLKHVKAQERSVSEMIPAPASAPVYRCVSGIRGGRCVPNGGTPSPQGSPVWHTAPPSDAPNAVGFDPASQPLDQPALSSETRVVYVGRLRSDITRTELKRRFEVFGEIEECTVNLRDDGDNFGFITYRYTCDAVAALENGHTLRRPKEPRPPKAEFMGFTVVPVNSQNMRMTGRSS